MKGLYCRSHCSRQLKRDFYCENHVGVFLLLSPDRKSRLWGFSRWLQTNQSPQDTAQHRTDKQGRSGHQTTEEAG